MLSLSLLHGFILVFWRMGNHSWIALDGSPGLSSLVLPVSDMYVNSYLISALRVS